MRKLSVFIFLLFCYSMVAGQNQNVLSFDEYLAFVKKHHPIVKQANLVLSESEARLLKARGAFDPKLAVDYDRKEFKETTYYDKLNTSFKIPTWYGVELKGSYENNDGVYLGAESTVPATGLYSMGLSLNVLKGLVINERMATLKQAKLYVEQAQADNQLMVNGVLYEAITSYFLWLKAYQEKALYEQFYKNAEIRFEQIVSSHKLGELPAIDTTEARILLYNRQLFLENANLNYNKATLSLSNYLWLDDVPIELQPEVLPDTSLLTTIDQALQLDLLSLEQNFSNHPKLRSLDLKYQQLEVERKLKVNNLLPSVNFQYNFLTDQPTEFNDYQIADYKLGVAVNVPIFLRAARGDLKITNYKMQAVEWEGIATELSIQNKYLATIQEINSYQNQVALANTLINDYQTLLQGEERKFQEGESSIFLINARESKLIENSQKAIELQNKLLQAKGDLFHVLGLTGVQE